MKIQKRLLAAVAALAIVVNQSMLPIYAEETTTSSTTSESTSTATTAETTESASDSQEGTTSTTIESTNESSTEGTTTIPTEISTSTESTSETSRDDTPKTAPNLEFSINNEWQWEKNTDGWTLKYDEATTSLYYKVSQDWFAAENDYLATGATEWTGFDNLEEGSYYIAFWAVDKSDNTLVTVSDVKHYQYDKTAPASFEIESNVERKGWHNYLVVSSKNSVLDNESGIQGIYYTVNADQRPVEQQWTAIQYEEKEGKVDISFTLDASLKDASIVVYVVDNAGWQSTASLNVANHDHQTPEITNVSIVTPSYSDNDTEKKNPNWNAQEPHEYGHDKLEDHPVNKYIYASDESFIKINVNDDLYDLKFKVAVNGHEVSYTAEDLVQVEGDYSTNGTYYIPLNNVAFDLSANDVFSVSVEASDSQNTSELVSLDTEVFYDPNGTADSKIAPSLSGNYTLRNADGHYSNNRLNDKYDAYFGNPGESKNNSVSISISDDVGLSSYSISVNGTTVQAESNLAEGVEKEGSYHVTTEVTDEAGNVSTETSSVTVTYKDKTKVPTKDNPCEIPLSNEGEYKIEVTVIDLAGNSHKEEYIYFVDTQAPIIGNNGDGSFTYSYDSDLLQYFSFGIFGHTSITLSVTVNDGGHNSSGISQDDIKLYWAPENSAGDLTEYSVVRVEGNKFVFSELPISEGSILSAVPFITVCDYMRNESKYYFKTESGVLNRADAEELEKATLVLETFPPEYTITPSGSNYKVVDNRLYFGDKDDSSLTFGFSDNTGIDRYGIEIQNQSSIDSIDTCLSDGDAAIAEDSVSVDISNLDTGEYPLKVYVKDLTGYEITEAKEASFDTSKFYIDKTAPVVNNVSYSVQSSMLKYFTFGIFGNETISISVQLSDNDRGSGIETVTLWWGKDYTLSGKGDGEYTFGELSPSAEYTPYITITDKMGNESTYYFATVDNGCKESDIGELILDGETDAITLMLEDNIEVPVISVPDGFNVNGETWYPTGIEYKVSITDKDSGLNKVVVTENDKTTTENGVRNGKAFEEERYVTEAEFTYQLNDANHYDIGATAYDNAGNMSETANMTVHIDLEDPNITHFEFGGQNGNGSTGPKITTYGYFFQQDTEARVYVNDPGVSSGIRSVQLWLEGVEGSSYSGDKTVSSSDQENYNMPEGYAKFTIPMGFKGKVYAEVVDNVEHTSGVINADGNIVEDSDIHARTSSIDIHEDVETDKADAAQVPLYNRNIPLTITVKDTFSGISTIEWSIANDNESGTISVSPNGDVNGNGVNIGDTETDSNLVTSIQFTLSVDDNSNGNIVKIVLTDRSGNISEASKTYSIDTTAPTVTAGIANGTAHNGSYYNSDLTVNIAITERNFNGGEVQVTLNGNTQTVQWDDDGSTVGQDGTVHHASFPINGDGDYTYSVSYTDRAGNPGNTVSSDKFTIDKKAPEATITFDVGDDTKDDAYYNSVRTATFAVEEHNYGSAVIKITKDGTDVSGSYDLNNWKPNDHAGDNHTQSVTLKEESGYYQVSITVTDMAGNTFQTSSKKFYIDLAAPEVHINVENVKNGAPSNDKTITPSISIVDHEGNLDPESISLKVTVVKLTDENEIKSFTALDYHGLSAWKDGDGSIKLDNENSPNEISFNMNNLEEDGIYTITVSASDLAGNTGGQSSEDKQKGSEYKLSVNRLGSTYEVDDKIVSKDPELRYYQNNDGSPFAFTITEYNVNTLNPTDTIVKITCDGNVIDNEVKATEETGDNTWSKYTYEFPPELFENSGKYIIKLYSVDAAGNENPLEINGDDERATVTFFIDNISPEVHFRDADDKTEFTNEDPYRTDLKHIEVEVYDNSMQEAQDVVFKLNGEELSVNHDAGSMIYTFDIPSKTSLQTLNMTLKDIAGNETDTGVEDFLITTNVFILWFKNTPLFIGTILALLAVIGGIVFAVVRKKPRGFN